MIDPSRNPVSGDPFEAMVNPPGLDVPPAEMTRAGGNAYAMLRGTLPGAGVRLGADAVAAARSRGVLDERVAP